MGKKLRIPNSKTPLLSRFLVTIHEQKPTVEEMVKEDIERRPQRNKWVKVGQTDPNGEHDILLAEGGGSF